MIVGMVRQVTVAALVVAAACSPPRDVAGDPSATSAEQNSAASATFVSVSPAVETEPVGLAGDVADDPAIWLHPDDPSASRIIATAKDEGLYVYDLLGNVVQRLMDGRMNNVDVRYGFPLGDREVDVVAASEQSAGAVALYAIDPATGLLADVADGPQASGLESISGLCMYRSAASGRFYVFANDATGLFRQWELVENGGRISILPVRDFRVASPAEGCTADDGTGALYVAEEDVGLWRFGAEPEDGGQPAVVARVDSLPAITADLEGLTIYHGAGTSGYLIASSQGNASFAVFDRGRGNAYLGSFIVDPGDAGTIDGTSDTDGVDVISASLGPDYAAGLFVAQDGSNEMPAGNQNFKLVGWDEIAGALGLELLTGWDPRSR